MKDLVSRQDLEKRIQSFLCRPFDYSTVTVILQDNHKRINQETAADSELCCSGSHILRSFQWLPVCQERL